MFIYVTEIKNILMFPVGLQTTKIQYAGTSVLANLTLQPS